MKLKELPKSLWTSYRLSRVPVIRLGSKSSETIPVIVSLTSIPSRLSTLHLTVRSLMQQSFLPEKIVLWLHHDLKGGIPKKLEKLRGDLFEIRFSQYTFSHRKLIHSLEVYPNKIIVTCDDDLIYDRDLLKVLFKAHLKFPKTVIGNRCRKMSYSKRQILSYEHWPFVKSDHDEDAHLMPVGAFGILYPVGVLDDDVTNVDLFMKLTPKADDLWFKAMAVKNGTLSRVNSISALEPTPILGTQKIALKKINKDQDFNKVQWERVCKYYGWDKSIVERFVGIN